MIELIRGATETVVLNVSDELQNLTDLTLAEPINWEIYREFDREVILLTGTATVDPDNAMQALCLIDTTTLPSGRLELYAELTAAPDQPILGPFIMKIEGGTQAGIPDSVYYQTRAEKAQPNGYASLDNSGLVPIEQVPYVQGPPGPPGVSTARYTQTWNWSVLITDTPATGQVSINVEDWSLATFVAVNDLTADHTDVTLILGISKIGDELYLQAKNDSTRWARYEIVGDPIDQGTSWLFPVTFIEGGGIVPNNNAATIVSLVTMGGSQNEIMAPDPSTPALTVMDSSGNVLFRVDNAGVHIKTGTTIIADL
jgi:hypothetical protein